MRQRQFALCSRASSSRFVEVADHVIRLLLDPVQIPSDDLADRLLKARQVRGLPLPEDLHFVLIQILLLIERRIINIMAEIAKKRRYLPPPRLAVIRRILDGS